MNISFLRKAAIVLALGLSGCAVGPGGYDNSNVGIGVGVGFGFDYYEPFGGYYGGWGPDYRVAPYRGNYGRPEYRGNNGGYRGNGRGDRDNGGGYRGNGGGNHSYRPPATTRPTPSIPSRPRGGGERQGGSRQQR